MFRSPVINLEFLRLHTSCPSLESKGDSHPAAAKRFSSHLADINTPNVSFHVFTLSLVIIPSLL